jgi:hypothetical protein
MKTAIKLVGMGLFLGGCPMMDEDDKDSADTGDSPAALAAISGTVGRSAPLAPDGDGVGLLLVAVLEECSFTSAILGSSVTPSADLSAEGATVPFSIGDLPRQPVYLALFLDDDGNADPAQPLPDVGDLVYGTNAGDGALDCVEVDLSAGDQGAVALELNLLEE